MRRFISGPLAGTKLEIMPSKPATHLPDGTPINYVSPKGGIHRWDLNNTQRAHDRNEVDVHAPQVFDLLNDEDKVVYRWEGPSIAQEWKLLYKGERPFYRNMGRA